jgi:hypothetical protein
MLDGEASVREKLVVSVLESSMCQVEVIVKTCNRIGCCSSRRFRARAVRLFDNDINRVNRGNKFVAVHFDNSTPHRPNIYPFTSTTAFTRLSHQFSAKKND